MANVQTNGPKPTLMDLFVNGARRGWTIGTTSMLPNLVMAFVIIQALNVTGLLDVIGKVFGPVMALWGLPGQAAAVLMASFMSMGGGVGVAASLYAAEQLTANDVTVLVPAIFLMGALLQYMGRCLGTAEVNSKYWPLIIGICVLNALLAMWTMRLILVFL
ncbi:MAG: YjiG family protein [bacterium]|jgi:spore maturation protein SpmB